MERLYYQDLYKGYELNDSVCIWSLSDRDIRILDAAVDLVENNYTLRELAVNSMIPRSIYVITLNSFYVSYLMSYIHQFAKF